MQQDENAPDPYVFLCYAHESDRHKAMVLEFAEFLRHNGIRVVVDRQAETERRDWDLWARQSISRSRYVLVIVSETVRGIADGDMPDGFRGVRAELNLLRELYNGQPLVWPKRILPVVLPGRSKAEIPSFLQPNNADHYPVTAFTVAGASALLRQLGVEVTTPQSATAQATRVARHWEVSARGTDLSAIDFWFTGRRHALALISDFTQAGRPGLLAVTGMPGAGKSALLGVCVLRSQAPGTLPPQIRSSIPDCSIKAAVHARGKNADTVLAELGDILGGAPRHGVDVRDMLDELIDPASPPVCVIDALDEAEDPTQVADAVRWLSGRAVTIAGVRSDTLAGLGTTVLPAVLRPRHPAVIDLDAPAHTADRDVSAYVAQRLRADTARPGGYGTPAWAMDVLVDVIGAEVHDEVAAGNFLIAQLVVEELLAAPVVTARRRGWSSELHWPGQLQDWIRRDVHRRLGDAAAAAARSTLAPVAYALRGGLTLDLWRTLVARFGPAPDPDSAIVTVSTQLGFYLTSPTPGHFAVRHEQFAGYFAAGLPAGRGNDIFVDVLVDRVPRAGDGRRDWAQADEYTAANLLAHAHAAGRISEVIDEHPTCLARVDPLSAATLLAGSADTAARNAADVLRRAGYASSEPFGERAAALQAHAALAGTDRLATAILEQAGPWMPWRVRWTAGAPDDTAVAVGGVDRTQAVVGVASQPGEPPSVVLLRTDGRCSVRDAATGQSLAPDLFIGDDDGGAGDPPMLVAWQTPAGSVLLAAGRSDGRITVWTLTGAAAGSVVWRSRSGPGLRDLARVAGPHGTDLIVVLADGNLTVRPLRPYEAPDSAAGALLHTSCPAARVLALAPTRDAAAFLTAGPDADLTAWRISAELDAIEPTVHPGRWARTDTIVAGGDADRACVLSNAGQAVHSTWLTADLRSAGPPQRLHDGGRTAPMALTVGAGAATAAVADGAGSVSVFDLRADALAVPTGRHDTDDIVFHLAFLDPRGGMLAVGGWPGTVTVLDISDRERARTLRMRHGESGVTIHPLGRSDPHRFLATRGLNGLTRLWQLPPAASFSAGDEPPVTLLRCVPLDDGRLLAVAAPAGDERLRCWLVDPDRNRCDDLPAVIHPGGLTAVAGIRAGGRVHVVTAGESGTRLWTAEADGILRWVSTVPACHQDVEHVILSAVETGRMIVGTAGAEHLQLWTYDGAAFTAVVTSEDDYVTAVATGRSGDRTVVVTGDDDGVVRLIELSSGSDPKIRTVHQGKPVVAVAVMTEDRRVTAVAADRYGALSAGTTDGTAPAIESVPWQISHLRAVGNRIFGVASTPPRLLGWQLDADGRLHLDAGPLGALRGTPLHMAGTASAVAVADGGGQVLMVDVDLRVTAANLNLTADALTGVPGTGMFIMARGARLICLAAGSTAPPAGPWPAPATAAPAGRPG